MILLRSLASLMLSRTADVAGLTPAARVSESEDRANERVENPRLLSAPQRVLRSSDLDSRPTTSAPPSGLGAFQEPPGTSATESVLPSE